MFYWKTLSTASYIEWSSNDWMCCISGMMVKGKSDVSERRPSHCYFAYHKFHMACLRIWLSSSRQLTAWSVSRLPLIYERTDCGVSGVVFFSWNFVPLKGGVTLKAVEKKVMGKMFVSKGNEGTAESCVMKRFMICTHQLIFQITCWIESNLTICLPLVLIWATVIHFTRAHHCNMSWAG